MTEVRVSRAAAQLKTRLIEQHRAEFDRALAWAASDPAIEAAAATITAARRRFVLGAAISFTHASLLAARLSAALGQVTLIDGTIVRPLDILSDVRDSDVLIAISLRRYRRYTVDSAVPFVRAGGRLVLITDGPGSPLQPLADVAVSIADVGERGPRGTHEPSPAVVGLVLDLLAALSVASAKGGARRMAERDRLADELGLHVDPGTTPTLPAATKPV